MFRRSRLCETAVWLNDVDGRDKPCHDGLGRRGFHASHFIGGVGPEACEITSALSVIASKAKQSRLGLRACGLVWIASLSLAMTTSRFLYSLTSSEQAEFGSAAKVRRSLTHHASLK